MSLPFLAARNKFQEWQVVSGGLAITGDKFTMPSGGVVIQPVFVRPIPKTGDGATPGLWLLALCASLGALGVILFQKRRDGKAR